MTRRLPVMCLLLCLLASVACYAQTPAGIAAPKKADAEPPPAGVTLEVLPPAQPAAPQGAGGPTAPGGNEGAAVPAKKAEDPKIDLFYDGVPLEEVLQELQDELKVLIVCENERILKTRVWIHMTVRQSRAIMMVTSRVFRIPVPAHILCTKGEVVETDDPLKVGPSPLMNLKLEDAVLKDALAYVTKKAEAAVGVTAALADKKVTFEAKGADAEKMMTELAEKAECECITGYMLVELNMDAQLEKLEQMSDEDLEKMFSGALKSGEVQRGVGEVSAGDVQGGMQDGIKMFQDMDPEERKALVERAVGTVGRFNGILQRLSPETRSGLKSMVQPFLAVAIGGYFSLDPRTKSELAPVMKSLGALKW